MLKKIVKTLIGQLVEDNSLPLSSTETSIKNHRCQFIVTRAPIRPEYTGIYRVLVSCTPLYESMKPLLLAKFSKKEVEVLELLQRGKDINEICRALPANFNTVKYYLRSVKKKLRSRGKAETTAKAIARSRGIAILCAMVGNRAELHVEDARGWRGRPRKNRQPKKPTT